MHRYDSVHVLVFIIRDTKQTYLQAGDKYGLCHTLKYGINVEYKNYKALYQTWQNNWESTKR